jgi:choline dehydrogenase
LGIPFTSDFNGKD